MKKIFSTVVFLGIIVVFYLLFSGKIIISVHEKNYKKIVIQGKHFLISKIELNPHWMFSSHLKESPQNIERWQEVILLSQSDFLKYLSNKEAYKLYGRLEITDALIDAQRKYVTEKFEHTSLTMGVSKIYIVLDDWGKTCHMIVPIQGNQGVFYTSFELIRGEWRLVPSSNFIPWEIKNAKEIINAIEAEDIKYVKSDDFSRFMSQLSATYLE